VSRDLDGYRVLGRSGLLGVVDGARRGPRDPLLVCGGVSGALTYHVPLSHVRDVSVENRTVSVDLDVTDFVPTLLPDGTIELHATHR
jgi:hypothetical protein